MPIVRGARALVLVAGLLVAACGGEAPPSSTPAPATPRPTLTPDPHLVDPASADVVLRTLQRNGLRITANNASAGRDGEPRKAINATFDGWPLTVSEFTSAAALREATGFDPSKAIAAGDATFTYAGLNILVEYGPDVHGPKDAPPTDQFHASATRLAEELDILLGPLEQVALRPVRLGSTTTDDASATPAPSADPSAAPSATP